MLTRTNHKQVGEGLGKVVKDKLNLPPQLIRFILKLIAPHYRIGCLQHSIDDVEITWGRQILMMADVY